MCPACRCAHRSDDGHRFPGVPGARQQGQADRHHTGAIPLVVADAPVAWQGKAALSAVMGLLLSAIAVQMLVSGLRGCFPVLA
ncbi:hypothetical protein KBZ12_11240 [Cyanobium sp. Cruz CV13-4-11]|jgi:hypothetical protein|uniref:hypothetical protein n=1 Tax=unclassified Cyanobium TaxID=2627006 RepID=UPI0020CC83F3|nr:MULTISPECIES: hypothetical protein [unclassified Cyanobium]MCP9901038.1 hypothetical protein [Cyanobium sp. Cruz CV11-17]MCP9920040.1 hypothetical protein [Cyanobium sp. Cruz CV13-4-11]